METIATSVVLIQLALAALVAVNAPAAGAAFETPEAPPGSMLWQPGEPLSGPRVLRDARFDELRPAARNAIRDPRLFRRDI